jgi:hypothetical protein
MIAVTLYREMNHPSSQPCLLFDTKGCIDNQQITARMAGAGMMR